MRLLLDSFDIKPLPPDKPGDVPVKLACREWRFAPGIRKANGDLAPLELGILLDRSYSMQRLQSTTLESFNALLAEQKQLGPAATRLTLMLVPGTFWHHFVPPCGLKLLGN
jgi:hypothetical protein